MNGQEGYGFMVAAVDGGTGKNRQQDRLRLKVWELATGRIVYDNQVGAGEGAVAATALVGGEIIIHRPLDLSPDQIAALAEEAGKESNLNSTAFRLTQVFPPDSPLSPLCWIRRRPTTLACII